jgi:hypothetical protein
MEWLGKMPMFEVGQYMLMLFYGSRGGKENG